MEKKYKFDVKELIEEVKGSIINDIDREIEDFLKEKEVTENYVKTYYNVDDCLVIAGDEYKISGGFMGYFLVNCDNPLKNNLVFTKLGIYEPKRFISEIVGYDVILGLFPFVQSLDDLNKVIAKLDKINMIRNQK